MTLQQKGIAALTEIGYAPNSYNPHGMVAWVISNEFGEVAVTTGECAQDALDNAVDDGLLNSELMNAEDYKEYNDNGWHDSYTYAGNASEPIWTEYLSITEIDTDIV